MAFYRLTFCLLLCSHAILADSYWSHVPGMGAVQLTTLNAAQHSQLAQHLGLSSVATKQWLDELPEVLDALSCSIFDVQAQPLPAYIDPHYKVVGYSGVLKFLTDELTKDTMWWLPWNLLPLLPELSAGLADLSVQIHQPLLLTEQQLEQKNQLIIISGGTSSYFALQLHSIERPELLWSVDPAKAGFEDLTGAMAQPVLMQPHNESGLPALSLLLPNTGANEQKTLIYKVDAMTGVAQARLTTQQKVSELSGALTLYDQNRDSTLDRLLFCTKAGQIWQAQVENNQFYDINLVADLSVGNFSDIQFISTLYAAVPVGGYGSDFHSRRSQWLVLLSALQQQKSVFIVLKQQDGELTLTSDLVNRTLPQLPAYAALTDQEWQQLQQKNGWYSQLTGRLSYMPVVAAGVIYLRLLSLDTEQLCSMERASSALLALHLYHASPVYHHPLLALENTSGALSVQANTEGGFDLVEQNNHQVLIKNILEISPGCTYCSATIHQNSFPRWQLMGTYHAEEGAYE